MQECQQIFADSLASLDDEQTAAVAADPGGAHVLEAFVEGSASSGMKKRVLGKLTTRFAEVCVMPVRVCACVCERERERVCVRVCVVCVCVCVCVVCVCVCGTCVWRCERWRVVGSRELKSGGWLIHEERPALFTQTRAVSTQRGSTSPQAPSRGVHRAKRGRRGAMVYYPELGGWLLRVRWGGRRVRTCNGLGLPPRRGQGLEQFVSDSS